MTIARRIPESIPQQLARVARAHGFDAHTEGPEAVFYVPLARSGRFAGYHEERVRSWRELRDALGY